MFPGYIRSLDDALSHLDDWELLASPTAKRFLASLAEHADLVIVDSPPVLAVADGVIVVVSVADGVIVVVSRTDRRKVTKAIGQLHQIEAPLLGTVLNGADLGGDAYSYGYAYTPTVAEPTGDAGGAGLERADSVMA